MNDIYKIYLAIAGGALYAFKVAQGNTIWAKALAGALGAVLGWSTYAEIADWLQAPEAITAVFVTAFSVSVLDIMGGLLADRNWIIELLKNFIGGKK